MIIAHQTVLPLQAYLILLCFTLSHFKDIAFFAKSKVCGNPSWNSILAPVRQSICLLHVSASHFGNSCNVSNFSFLNLLLWSVIFAITTVLVLGLHELAHIKTANLIDDCCVCSDCSGNQKVAHLSPSPCASLFPGDTTILKLGQ